MSSQRSSEWLVGFAYPRYLESYKNITPVSHKRGQGLSRGAHHSKAENALNALTLPSLRPDPFLCISLNFFSVRERDKTSFPK